MDSSVHIHWEATPDHLGKPLSLQHANPSLCDSITQGHTHWLKDQEDCAFILVTLQPPQ